MKILQINNYHNLRGGSDRIYLETGRLLEQRGHAVSWFAGQHTANNTGPGTDQFPKVANLTSANPLELSKFIYNRDAARALDRKIRTEGRPDIAHLHIYHGGLTTSILPVLRRHKIPVVQTAHEYKLACPVYRLERHGQPCFDCLSGSKFNAVRHRCSGGSVLRSTAQWLESEISARGGDVRLLDAIVCVSNRQKDLLEQSGVPRSKLRLCYNFVDTANFAPQGHRQKSDYFLYFGRIETLKGVDILVEAARQSGLPTKFVGHGNWSDALQKQIADIPYASYLGPKSGAELGELVAQARAVIVPSTWEEPFGLTVVEALASGTPVIGSKIGAIPELLRDGIDGFLVPPSDPVLLADAMRKMTAENATRMGEDGRDRVATHFSPDKYISNLLNIFLEFAAFTA